MPSGGSCLLASINLSEFVRSPFKKTAYFDFDEFIYTVKQGTIYLNEVLEEGLPLHPLQEQRDTVADWRQIGLGIMGLADMFIKLSIPYGSEQSLELSRKIGSIMINASLQQSALIAKELGTYPKYKGDKVMTTDFFKELANEETVRLVGQYGLRNSQCLTTAPTGSLSTMWGISGGLEPIFQVSYTRQTKTLNNGVDSFYKVFTPIAQEYMTNNDIEDEKDLPNFFVTTSNLNYKDRINMQSVWQTFIDASISSTVNLPKETTVDEVVDLYLLAWKKGLKGVTIYRDGCKRSGILITEDTATDTPKPNKDLTVAQLKELMDKKILESILNDPNKCPHCGGKMMHMGGCHECEDCAYSPCSI